MSKLANEALDVFAETGMSPRELARDRAHYLACWQSVSGLRSERDAALARVARLTSAANALAQALADEYQVPLDECVGGVFADYHAALQEQQP